MQHGFLHCNNRMCPKKKTRVMDLRQLAAQDGLRRTVTGVPQVLVSDSFRQLPGLVLVQQLFRVVEVGLCEEHTAAKGGVTGSVCV